MEPGLLNRLHEVLWPKGFRRDVWMVVDAARDPRIYRLLLECFYSTHTCLFAGTLAPQLKVAAPYLVPLDEGDKKTRKFLNQAWGNNWGVLLKCDTRADALRRHVRRLLTVRDPQGKRLLFRFYDPRVLPPYLASCNSEELDGVFGPVECFWTESKTTENLLEFRSQGGKLLRRTLCLAQPPGERANLPAPVEPSLTAGDRPRPGSLVIRQQQIALFAQAEVERFVNWVQKHAAKFFPAQCRALGDTQLRRLIHSGIERAARYGIKSERDVCKFIDLMIVFGETFDTNPKLAWASQILSAPEAGPSRMRALFEAAKTNLTRA